MVILSTVTQVRPAWVCCLGDFGQVTQTLWPSVSSYTMEITVDRIVLKTKESVHVVYLPLFLTSKLLLLICSVLIERQHSPGSDTNPPNRLKYCKRLTMKSPSIVSEILYFLSIMFYRCCSLFFVCLFFKFNFYFILGYSWFTMY